MGEVKSIQPWMTLANDLHRLLHGANKAAAFSDNELRLMASSLGRLLYDEGWRNEAKS